MTQITPIALQEWWDSLPFKAMTRITGYEPTDFNPEEGYQDFVDACDDYWEHLTDEEKINLYNEYN